MAAIGIALFHSDKRLFMGICLTLSEAQVPNGERIAFLTGYAGRRRTPRRISWPDSMSTLGDGAVGADVR